MKKILILLLICFCSYSTIQAQDSDGFSRKGKILVETGYNLIASTFRGTGASIIVSDGETITSIGAEMGYFLQENFALKFKLSIVDLGFGGTVTALGVGGKYYIAGKVPFEFAVGLLTGDGIDAFNGNLSIGYAVNLAHNILLEPSLGLLAGEDELFGGTIPINFRIAFVMIL
jgi:hypothetical protein